MDLLCSRPSGGMQEKFIMRDCLFSYTSIFERQFHKLKMYVVVYLFVVEKLYVRACTHTHTHTHMQH
jgi:hypothetical protein